MSNPPVSNFTARIFSARKESHTVNLFLKTWHDIKEQYRLLLERVQQISVHNSFLLRGFAGGSRQSGQIRISLSPTSTWIGSWNIWPRGLSDPDRSFSVRSVPSLLAFFQDHVLPKVGTLIKIIAEVHVVIDEEIAVQSRYQIAGEILLRIEKGRSRSRCQIRGCATERFLTYRTFAVRVVPALLPLDPTRVPVPVFRLWKGQPRSWREDGRSVEGVRPSACFGRCGEDGRVPLIDGFGVERFCESGRVKGSFPVLSFPSLLAFVQRATRAMLPVRGVPTLLTFVCELVRLTCGNNVYSSCPVLLEQRIPFSLTCCDVVRLVIRTFSVRYLPSLLTFQSAPDDVIVVTFPKRLPTLLTFQFL